MIAEKIKKVMDEVSFVQKDMKVGSGNYGYKATSSRQVIRAVRESMIKHGLVLVPTFVLHNITQIQTSKGG